MKKLNLNYDDALAELQGILDRMQRGETTLEVMQVETKRALALINYCRERLRSIGESMDQLLAETVPDDESE